jgi:hypothetical protein
MGRGGPEEGEERLRVLGMLREGLRPWLYIAGAAEALGTAAVAS